MQELNEQFAGIYDQYIEKIYRFVYLKVNSQEIAEDITSRVFSKGWESFQKQKGNIQNPASFLYQIARNAVIDHYRQKAKSTTISPDAIPELISKDAHLQDKAILASDVAMVRQALGALDQESQDIIIWHYLEGIPLNEIAEMINRPAGTVRVMLHRGLKDLRGKMQEG